MPSSAASTCKSPVWILARGDKIYVANNGEGRSTSAGVGTWSLDNELTVSYPNIACLTAPGGKHFDGHILVTTAIPKRDIDSGIRVNRVLWLTR